MNDANLPLSKASTSETLTELLTRFGQNGLLALLESAARQATAVTTPSTLRGDILRGAAEIAEFLYGERKHRRKVYNLVGSGKLPHFRLGTSVCARKSVLLNWVAFQEKRT